MYGRKNVAQEQGRQQRKESRSQTSLQLRWPDRRFQNKWKALEIVMSKYYILITGEQNAASPYQIRKWKMLEVKLHPRVGGPD